MALSVQELTQEINGGLTQTSSSAKDETKFMRTMLNDRNFAYDQVKNGEVYKQVCPAQEARDMIGSVMSSAAKIPAQEARQLAEAYDFKNAEADNMIAVSKGFVNNYLETGRKLPLGGPMDIAISKKHVPETTCTYPQRVGVDESGKPIYQNGTAVVPAHDTIKVFK